MTWDELKEKAKEMGASIYISPLGDNFERIGFKNVNLFNDNGDKYVSVETERSGYVLLATDRTPEQMLMIVRGLE